MQLNLYQVDAFSHHVFSGNPAAVCPLEQWLPDSVLQAIAAENNLSETAFFVAQEKGFKLRWFTPQVEVDLCGHATLASAYVLFELMGYATKQIDFYTRSGQLTVTQTEQGLVMDFPAQQPQQCEASELLIQGLGMTPIECWAGMDYLAVLKDEASVHALKPDFHLLKQLDRRGVIITAKSTKYDFVSRFFAPNYGIDEDPVTGSAHTILAPFWAEKLNKLQLSAKQVSARGGEVICQLKGERVMLSGKCVHYLSGTINIPDNLI